MDFVPNFIRFLAVQFCENRLRFHNVTDSLKVGTFLDTVHNGPRPRQLGLLF